MPCIHRRAGQEERDMHRESLCGEIPPQPGRIKPATSPLRGQQGTAGEGKMMERIMPNLDCALGHPDQAQTGTGSWQPVASMHMTPKQDPITVNLDI